MRSRIRTVMNGEGLYTRPFHIHEKSRSQGERRVEALIRSTQKKIADALQPRDRILPWLALNEVFMGEFLAARPITLVIQVAGETHKVRSSGICVCTGSGSRSWYKSMNFRPADTVHNIIEIATGKKLKPDETNDLLYKYHRALMYPPDDKQMTYMIREMVRTMRCKMGNCCSEREKCYKLTVKSAGFDAGLVIDGSISLPFNDGTTASFEIKPENSLRQILVT
ncbi:PREDICTED: NAD kinase 2, mitochondrial-like [Dufourea novaeangliae]|nr:PREDICTED: NAD kinase 2, mitochondrial-like [Dufourea novaeangliae]